MDFIFGVLVGIAIVVLLAKVDLQNFNEKNKEEEN